MVVCCLSFTTGIFSCSKVVQYSTDMKKQHLVKSDPLWLLLGICV